jgi:hypothetical protein
MIWIWIWKIVLIGGLIGFTVMVSVVAVKGWGDLKRLWLDKG